MYNFSKKFVFCLFLSQIIYTISIKNKVRIREDSSNPIVNSVEESEQRLKDKNSECKIFLPLNKI